MDVAAACVLLFLQAPSFEELVRRLGSEDVLLRDRSQAELVSRGESSLPELRKALETARDPEIRTRLRAVISEFDPWLIGKRMATIPDGAEIKWYVHLEGPVAFYTAGPEVRTFLGLNDWKSGSYDDIAGKHISDDRKTVAYAARTGTKWRVVVGESEGEPFDYVEWGPQLSADGTRFIYAANTGGKEVSSWRWSGGDWWIVTQDGKIGPFNHANHPMMTSDGSRIAYSVRRGEAWVAVVDGHEREGYDWVGIPRFSADGKQCAFAVARGCRIDKFNEPQGGTWSILIDGAEIESVDAIGALAFSPDGKELAYTMRSGAEWFVQAGSRRFGPFLEADAPVYSPDGKRFAFCARLIVDERELGVVVIDGVRSEPSRYVGSPEFSRDSASVAYSIKDDSGEAMVINGREGARFHTVGPPVFSPDGKVLAFTAQEGAEDVLVIGDRTIHLPGQVWGIPAFSPDGTQVGVATQIDREIWWKVFARE